MKITHQRFEQMVAQVATHQQHGQAIARQMETLRREFARERQDNAMLRLHLSVVQADLDALTTRVLRDV